MKNTNGLLITALMALSLTLASCNALLSPTSIFEKVDKPDTSGIASQTGTNLLDSLAKQDGSAKFYDSLTPAQETQIANALTSLKVNPDETIRSDASLALVELTVKTNQTVEDTVNSIADLLFSDSGTEANSTEALMDTLTGVLGPLANDTDALAAFLTDMDTISDSYQIVTVGDVQSGDLQTYMVAAVFATLVDVYGGDTNPSAAADAAAALSDYLLHPTDPIENTLLVGVGGTPGAEADTFLNLITGTDGKVKKLSALATLAGLETLGQTIKDALPTSET